MSLESNIQELTSAIVTLTKRIDAMENTSPRETEAKTEAKTEEEITHEYLKKEFLARIRKDMSKKPLYKKLLTDRGCMKILDLTHNQLQEVAKEMLKI